MKNLYNLYKDFIDKEVIDLLESNELHKEVISTEILGNSIELFYNNIIKIISLRDVFRENIFFKTGEHIEIDKEYDILDSIKIEEDTLIPIHDHLKLNDIKILSEFAFYLYKLALIYNEELKMRRRDDYEKIENSKFKALFEGKITLEEAKKSILDKNNKIKNIETSFLNVSSLDKDAISRKDEKYFMICKFTDLSFIVDNNKHRKFNNEYNVYKYENHISLKNNNAINSVLEDMTFNKNNYLSGIGSFVFINENKFLNNLQNYVNEMLDYENYEFDNVRSIKNIFIIMNDLNTSSNKIILPYFNNIIHPKNDNIVLNINTLSLDDFCNIYSSLNYEYKLLRAKILEDMPYNLDNQVYENVMKYNILKMIISNASINRSIFCFYDSTWSTVRTRLLNYGININTGDSTKRAMLSPISFDLSLFLFNCLSITHSDVARSFNNINKKYYSSKGVKYPEIKLYDPINTLNMFSNYYNMFENGVRSYDNLKLKSLNLQNDDSSLKIINVFINRILNKKFDIEDNVVFNICNNYLSQINDVDVDKESSQKYSKLFNQVTANRVNSVNKINLRKFSTSALSRDIDSKDSYYDKLRDIIEEGLDDPIKTQSKIEKEWINILMNDLSKEQNVLRSKLSTILDKAIEGANTNEFHKILNKLCGNLSKYLITKENILISLVEIVDNYSSSKRTNIAKSIGYAITREVYIKLISEEKIINKDIIAHNIDNIGLKSFIEIISNKKGKDINIIEILNTESALYLEYLTLKKDLDLYIKYHNDANDFLITLGTRFMELFSTRPNIVFLEVSVADGMGGSSTRLVLSDDYKEIVNNFAKLTVRPKNLPMLCKPLKWDSGKYGGYLENAKIKDKIITGSIKYNAHQYLNKEKLYSTINYFNSIPFGINTSLLDYIQNEGKYLLDNIKNSEVNSLKINNEITLKIANLFRDIPFYLNTHADWRGRIYTHSFYITYQGSELSSALVRFWKGEPLTEAGLRLFLAYGASLYKSTNNSKTEDERVNWINMNKGKILSLDREFILSSESPISFTAFCLEMLKLESDRGLKIQMPIFIDATCSGIQHISALIGDTELAKKVNLIPTIDDMGNENEKPEDFYLSLVDPINKAVNDFGKEHSEFSSLSELYLTRKILKQPIMTLNYNVSVFGMKEQLFNKLKVETPNDISPSDSTVNINTNSTKKNRIQIIGHTKDNKEIILKNRDLIQIAMIIKEIIFIHYPALKMVYDYFISVAVLMKQLNLNIQWVTPTGAVITQKYTKKEKTKLTIRSNRKTKTIVLYKNTKRIDHSKQIDGIIPNVIHSLDSSHIINFINESSKNVNFSILSVHDCFGTHPNHIGDLFNFLKEEFINLYINHDFLKKFDKNIISTIRNHYADDVEILKRKLILTKIDPVTNKTKTYEYELPTPPRKKDLNFDFIRFSKWMFN